MDVFFQDLHLQVPGWDIFLQKDMSLEHEHILGVAPSQ